MKLYYSILFLLVGFASKAQEKKEDFRDDWANLRHYQQRNEDLPAAKRSDKRVVFLGSSIFEFWKDRQPEFWNNHPNFVDRGISGQISPQLLIRFRQDVINLKPKYVVMLVGSNDLAGSTGHVSNESILNNIKSMVELAKKNRVEPILCLYLPIAEYPWRKEITIAAQQIVDLNETIKVYAKKKHLKTLDYWTPLLDEKTQGQKPEWTLDGVHPNKEGYEVMAKVTEEFFKGIL